MEIPQTWSASIPEMSEALALRRQVVSAVPRNNPQDVGHADCTESSLGQTGRGSDIIRVEWFWWRVQRSQFHYREIGVVDLGEI